MEIEENGHLVHGLNFHKLMTYLSIPVIKTSFGNNREGFAIGSFKNFKT